MKNADKSAYPFSPDLEGIPPTSDTYKRSAKYKSMGLTKRERFAMAAMQGILSKQAGAGDQLGDLTTRNMDKVAEASTQFADALLAELEKTEES